MIDRAAPHGRAHRASTAMPTAADVHVSVTIDTTTTRGWTVATALAGRISQLISEANDTAAGVTTAALITLGNTAEPSDDWAEPSPAAVADLLPMRSQTAKAAPRPHTPPVPEASGRLVLDAGRRVVLVDGSQVVLTRREFDLLFFLARHPSRVLDRAELITAVWGEAAGCGTRTADVHVRRLRMKLAAVAPTISTVRGVGYRFDAEERTTIVASSRRSA